MSEAEQSEGQSLEDILSSIRKKISDDPDMAEAAEPAPVLKTVPHSKTSNESAAGQGGAEPLDLGLLGPKPVTDPKDAVLPSAPATDSLSDILGRMEPQHSNAASAQAAPSPDDLSDLLDDPLPSPLQTGSTWDNASNSQTDPEPVPLASAQPVENSANKPNGPGFNLSSIIPSPDEPDLTTAPAPGSPSLSDKLDTQKQASSDLSPVIDAINAAEPEHTSPENRPNAVPRAMGSLTTGFAIPNSPDDDEIDTTSAPTNASALEAEQPAPSPVVTKATSIAGSFHASPETPAAAKAPTPFTASSSVNAQDGVDVASKSEQTATLAAEKVSTGGDQSDSNPTAAATPPGSSTLEEAVSEMLRPMLREWVEANMPRIVENALRIEVLETSKGGPTDDEG